MARKQLTGQSKKLKKLERFLKRTFPKQVYDKFVELTPEDTGYAKRHTRKRVKNDQLEIFATSKYKNYAEVLDKGLYPKNPRGGKGKTRNGFSKQAPRGMSEPTEKYAEKILKDFLRSIK